MKTAFAIVGILALIGTAPAFAQSDQFDTGRSVYRGGANGPAASSGQPGTDEYGAGEAASGFQPSTPPGGAGDAGAPRRRY